MDVRVLPSLVVVFFCLITAFASIANMPPPLKWLGSTDIAEGRGERGPWQQNATRYDYVDDPAVAIDDSGAIAVAWVDQGKKDVYFQRLSGDGVKQGLPVNVSRSAASFSWLPRLAIAADNPRKIYIVWQEIIFSGGAHGGDILFAVSEDGGTTFSAPRNMTASSAGDGKGRINRATWSNGSLDVAAGDQGKVYLAWTEYGGRLWFSRSSDGGKTFSQPIHIAGDDSRPARGPALAGGRARNVYLAWTVGEDKAADIRIAKSIDGGASFGPAQVAATTAGYSDAPKLALDAAGIVHLVWADSAGGPFERYRILYAQSNDGAQFGTPIDLSRMPDKPKTSVGYPQVATDAHGSVYVMWELYPQPKRDPRGLAMTISRDGGGSFTYPAAIPGSSDPGGGGNGSHQGLLMEKLAVNRHGAMVIANSALVQNERSRVWLMRAEAAPP